MALTEGRYSLINIRFMKGGVQNISIFQNEREKFLSVKVEQLGQCPCSGKFQSEKRINPLRMDTVFHPAADLTVCHEFFHMVTDRQAGAVFIIICRERSMQE